MRGDPRRTETTARASDRQLPGAQRTVTCTTATAPRAGIPPTAGFFGKWFVFRAAIDSGYYLLTIIAFVNSVIGAYYYLRVLVFMYMREPAAGAPIATPMRSGYVSAALILSAILVLALGLVPTSALDMAIKATEKTFVAPGG